AEKLEQFRHAGDQQVRRNSVVSIGNRLDWHGFLHLCLTATRHGSASKRVKSPDTDAGVLNGRHNTISWSSYEAVRRRYWKKLTLVPQRHVIDMFDADDEIIRRREPGKRAEFIDEMGLIVISAVQSYVRPVHVSAGGSASDRLAEAHESAICFWRQSHLFAEDLYEAALARADPVAGNC